MSGEARVDSTTMGDPERYQALDHLETALAALSAPTDAGRLVHLVRRAEGGRREFLQRTALAVDGGIPGDAWDRRTPQKPDAALAVMQIDVATLIANQQPIALFGDNLFVDLDLSAANLPTGSLVRLGGAVLRVTAEPHNGCRKFSARFGPEALRFVCNQSLRHRNLRGIYMRVVEGGAVAVGDTIAVLSRGGE
jgi:MOSC domain-containing protein YiiM